MPTTAHASGANARAAQLAAWRRLWDLLLQPTDETAAGPLPEPAAQEVRDAGARPPS